MNRSNFRTRNAHLAALLLIASSWCTLGAQTATAQHYDPTLGRGVVTTSGGYFPLEPSTVAPDIVDELGGNPGTMVGFPEDGSEWTPGMRGRGLAFDGQNQYVEHPLRPEMSYGTGTIEHWLRPGTDSDLRVAFYMSDSAGGSGAEYDGFGTAGTALEVHRGPGSVSSTASSRPAPAPPTKWAPGAGKSRAARSESTDGPTSP